MDRMWAVLPKINGEEVIVNFANIVSIEPPDNGERGVLLYDANSNYAHVKCSMDALAKFMVNHGEQIFWGMNLEEEEGEE